MSNIPKFKANLAQNQVSVVPASGIRAEAGALGDTANLLGQIATETKQAEEQRRIEVSQFEGQEKGRELLQQGANVNDYLKDLPVGSELPEDQAYVNGVMSSLQFKLSSDIDSRFADLSQQYANDPASFEMQSNMYLSELVKQAPAEYQQSLFEMGMRRKANIQTQITNSRKAAERKAALETHEEALGRAVAEAGKARATGDDSLFAERTAEAFSVIDAQYKAGLIGSEEAYNQRRQDVQNSIVKEGVLHGLKVADNREKYIEDTLSADIPGYTEEMKRELIDEVKDYKKDLDFVETASRNKRKLDEEKIRAEKLSNLELGIEEGTVSTADINDAWNKDIIKTAEKRTSLLNKVREKQDQLVKEQRTDFELSQALQGVGSMDKSNKDHILAVDKDFEERFLPQLEGMSSPEMAASVSKYVDRTGIIPSKIESLIKAAPSAGSVEQVQQAADLYDRIYRADPAALKKISVEDKAMLHDVTKFITAGMTPDEAVNAARERLTRSQNGAFTLYEQELEKTVAKDTGFYLNKAKAALDPSGLFNTPDIPADSRGVQGRLLADYKALYDEHFLKSGDYDFAEEQANAMINRVWGSTEVEGVSRVMKYPPENFAVEGDDTDWISKDLLESVKGHPSLGGYEPAEGDVLLLSDNRTARTAQQEKPDYMVIVKMEDGTLRPMTDDNGLALRWSPDYTKRKQELDRRQQEQFEKEQELAREQRLDKIMWKRGTFEERVYPDGTVDSVLMPYQTKPEGEF